MDELLDLWRETYDEMVTACEVFKAAALDASKALHEAERPFAARLQELEAEIRPLGEARAKTYKGSGVDVRYRKGSTRVSYDWCKVDSIRDVLRDVLPETAASLDGARKQSTGNPSVRIVRI